MIPVYVSNLLKPSGCHPTSTPSLWLWPLPGYLPISLGMHYSDKNLKRKKINYPITIKRIKHNIVRICVSNILTLGLPCSSDSKESACNAGDPGSIPESSRSFGEGCGSPPHHSCLENPIHRGAWRATVHGVTKSLTRLSN